MNKTLPRRIDSGVIVNEAESEDVCRDAGNGLTVCAKQIPEGAKKVTDQQVLIGRLPKHRECYRGQS